VSSRRLRIVKRCAWWRCGRSFRPSHNDQACCSRRCGALHRDLKRPGMKAARVRRSQEMRRQKYVERLRARLAGMTKGEIYRLGYTRGYTCGWTRGKRLGAVRRIA
jgi:hypothetical protein